MTCLPLVWIPRIGSCRHRECSNGLHARNTCGPGRAQGGPSVIPQGKSMRWTLVLWRKPLFALLITPRRPCPTTSPVSIVFSPELKTIDTGDVVGQGRLGVISRAKRGFRQSTNVHRMLLFEGGPCGGCRDLPCTEEMHPWAFKRRDPQKRIAALELYGTLFLALLLMDRQPAASCRLHIPLISDTQGNVYSILNNATRKMPSAVILMELVYHRSTKLDTCWRLLIPRERKTSGLMS